jgi:GNAT superfamily N-acetyltransferase
MKLYWVDPKHKKADVCRSYARLRGFLPPGDSPFLVCLGDNGIILGISVLDNDPADPSVLFMFVDDENRNKGIGRRMLDEITGVAAQAGMNSIRCAAFKGTGVNAFLEKCGFAIFPGSIVYKTTMKALGYSGQYRANIDGKNPGKACRIAGLEELDRDILKGFFDKETLDWDLGYDEKISFAGISAGKVDSVILCERIPKGIVFKYAYFDKDNDASLLECLRAWNELIKKSAEDHSFDPDIFFNLEKGQFVELIHSLVGEDTHILEAVETTIAVKLL